MSVIQIVGVVLGLIGAIASAWFIWERLFPFRRLSWRSAQKAAERICDQMRKQSYDPTLIVGIGRGGSIMGAMISGCLGHRALLVIDRKYMWMDGRRIDDMVLHIHLPPALIERVLIASGDAHSGNTMRLYFDYFVQIGAKEVRRSAFYVRKGCTEPIEYVGIRRDKDLQMPWMFSKHYVRDGRSQDEANQTGHPSSRHDIVSTSETRTCFIVRHGQSNENEAGDRYSGITESLLTEVGLRQAKDVGRALQSEGIERIFSSPMKRAVLSAREIQSLTGGHLIIDRRLREIDYGEWEGLTRREVSERWPELYAKYKVDPIANVPPAGEDPARVLERVLDFWNDLQYSPASFGVNKIVIVTHNSVARILLGHLNGDPLKSYREHRVDNASISKVLIDKFGKSQRVYVNQTSHLEGA